MLNVYRISDDEYIVATKNNAIIGDRAKTVFVLDELGFPIKQIEEGIVSLQINRHDVAIYGINRTFLFSLAVSKN